jgi:hypothetical protein
VPLARPAQLRDERSRLAKVLELPRTEKEWADVVRRLTVHAFERIHRASWELAEEFAHDAIADLLDPAYAGWDREKYPDLMDFLGSTVNGRVSNYWRRKSREGKRVALFADFADKPEVEGGDDPGEVPEEAPVDGEVVIERAPTHEAPDFVTIGEVAMATLRARVANDTMCTGILDLMRDGIGRAGDHAEALGVPVEEVYTAKRRLLHHARQVAQDLQQQQVAS